MGDGAANPYTLVAAVLQAARLGVVDDSPLPPAETGDGFEHTAAGVGVADDLAGALDALLADTALVAAVGPGLVANHVAIKRDEIARCAGSDPDGVRDYYIRHL
jgi:glutamine synthetase